MLVDFGKIVFKDIIDCESNFEFKVKRLRLVVIDDRGSFLEEKLFWF